jgi:hypothetical protein
MITMCTAIQTYISANSLNYSLHRVLVIFKQFYVYILTEDGIITPKYFVELIILFVIKGLYYSIL